MWVFPELFSLFVVSCGSSDSLRENRTAFCFLHESSLEIEDSRKKSLQRREFHPLLLSEEQSNPKRSERFRLAKAFVFLLQTGVLYA